VMDGRLERIPDGIEPIVGYRMWRYTVAADGAQLHSLNCSARVPGHCTCGWAHSGSDWALAGCLLDVHPNSAPAEECSCGFYAMATLTRLVAQAPIPATALGIPGLVEDSDREGAVLGRVELAGKIIEHDYGYRAERARVVELLPYQETEEYVRRLTVELDVPMGDSIALPSDEATIEATVVPSFTPRETAIIALVAQGYTTKEVAESLSVAHGTVQNHLARIHKKLGANSRLQAVMRYPPASPPGTSLAGASRGDGGFTVSAVMRWPLNVVCLVSVVAGVSGVGGALMGGG
jgi:DNA-binding CsgD family transcriptional regulator